jgi:hypothetical protein
MIETVNTCPLGSDCEKIVEGKLHRCNWYVEMAGMAQDGSEYKESKCAIAWQPILMVEMSSTNRGTSSAVESLRNETIKRQDAAIQLAKGFDNAKEISNK